MLISLGLSGSQFDSPGFAPHAASLEREAAAGWMILRSRRVLLAGATALALAHALPFLGYVFDDAYITFRYARNLGHGHGLVYNPAERVEGYTNFSWLLLSAAGDWLGVAPSWTIPPLGLLSLCGLVSLVAKLGACLKPDAPSAGVMAACIVASSTGVALYSVSGLETLFYALCLTGATLAMLRRQAVAFALWSAGAALTRPEGAVLCGVGCLFFVWSAHKQRVTPQAVRSGLGLLFGIGAAYAVFKWQYFHALLPNTFYAKRPDLRAGFAYTLTEALPLAGLLVTALIGSLRSAAIRPLCALWLLYATAIALEGGDWFPSGRMFVPYLPWLAVAFEHAFSTAVRSRTGLAIVAVLGLLAYLGVQVVDTKRMARSTAHTLALDQNRVTLAQALKRRGISSVAAHDIGLLGYVMDQATVIDLGGLVDSTIAHSPGGRSAKRIASDYLEARAPQAVLLASGAPQRAADGGMRAHALFDVERQVEQSAWFREHYALDSSHPLAPNYHLHVFLRR